MDGGKQGHVLSKSIRPCKYYLWKSNFMESMGLPLCMGAPNVFQNVTFLLSCTGDGMLLVMYLHSIESFFASVEFHGDNKAVTNLQ